MTSAGNNPTARRRELGVLLRKLRAERGWTVDYVAEQLFCSPSKISRLETGHRGASPRDIRDLADLYRVDDQLRARLAMLASEGKQRAWWQSLNLPYSNYVGLENEATAINDYGINVLPGLLQTADYARTVVSGAAQQWPLDIIEQRVSGRIARQRLLTREDPPTFRAVLDECVLHRAIGGSAVMAAQLERLLEVTELPNVSVRVVPFEAAAISVGSTFVILTFAAPTIPDVVYVESLTGEFYLEDAVDVAAYNATFWSLRELSLSAERSRQMIARFAAAYRSG